MTATVVEIDVAQPNAAEPEVAPRSARVLLDVYGDRRWFALTIKPRVLRGFDASLIIAGPELQVQFQVNQHALHAICALVAGSRICASLRASRIAVGMSPAICADVTMK